MSRTIGLASLAVAASAGLTAPAHADEPLADIIGVPEGPVLETIRAAVGTEEASASSVFEARQRGERARDRAQAALRSQGFYAARIEVRIPRGDNPRAQLQIDPGPLFVLGQISFDLGEDGHPEAARAAEEAAALTAGAPARAADVIAAETRAVAAIIGTGYPDARALDREVVVDHATGEMDVVYHFAAGRPAVLGPIRLSGTAALRPEYVQELAPYSPGDRYERAPLETLARRLRSTEAFASVRVRLAPSDQNGSGTETRDVVVEVDQGDRHTVTVGASYSSSEGGGVEADWTRRNMFGGGENLTVSGALKTIERRIDVELETPHWRTRPNRTLRLSASAIDEETDAFNRRAAETGAIIEQRLGPRLSGSIGASASLERIEDDVSTEDFALIGTSGAITWDGSDDPLDPTRGTRATGAVRPTFGVSDDAVGFVVADAAASYYQPLGSDRVVGAVRARAGTVLGPSLGELPADERFYAGGGGSVRGFDYQAISPRNDEGEIVGGRSVLEFSAEVRYRGEGRWGYAAFVDGGAAWSELEPEFDEIRWGAGVGVRYNTVVGPIRFDIAAPLDRRDGESPVQVYLSIGQAF